MRRSALPLLLLEPRKGDTVSIVDFYSPFRFNGAAPGSGDNYLPFLQSGANHTVYSASSTAWIAQMRPGFGGYIGFFPPNGGVLTNASADPYAPWSGVVDVIVFYNTSGEVVATFTGLASLGYSASQFIANPTLLVSGNDDFLGSTGADKFYAGAGDDLVDGDAGNDELHGEAGDDWLYGYTGNDTLYGGDGVDILEGGDGANTMRGGAGDDLYLSTSASDTIIENPNEGLDGIAFDYGTVFVLPANVEVAIYAGAGAIEIVGNGIDNALVGGDLADTLHGLAGADELYGGIGNDTLFGGAGGDLLAGGDGIDVVAYNRGTVGVEVNLALNRGRGGEAEGDAFDSIENIVGTNYGDRLTGNAEKNFIYGLDGDDMLWGNEGNDILIGAAGADVLTGGAGIDATSYHNSDGPVRVVLFDRVGRFGDADGDRFGSIENIIGSPFNDEIFGDNAANELYGQQGADNLYGNTGNDYIDGGIGDDKLYGQDGNDTLFGDLGVDLLYGGQGADTFYYRTVGESVAGATDIIGDFTRAHGDKINLSGIDANTNLGGDQAFSFIGSAAFSSTAGELRYAGNLLEADVNGDGTADFQVQLNVASLQSDDFLL